MVAAFAPRARSSSQNFCEQAHAQGTHGRPKKVKEKINYEKTKYHSGPLCASRLSAFTNSASGSGSRGTTTKPPCTRRVKHEGWAERYAVRHHRFRKLGVWRVFAV